MNALIRRWRVRAHARYILTALLQGNILRYWQETARESAPQMAARMAEELERELEAA